MEYRKPAPLKALTGLRCFAALNIVFFHFSDPKWFGWLAPVVNAGYASVSYFILLSGFVLGYNYNERGRAGVLNKARFYKARFTRLYPIYFLSLLLAWKMVPLEWGAHTHAMFWTGMVMTPLLLQGWVPEIATFLNTPAWTMSAEWFFYLLFPFMATWKKPERKRGLVMKLALVWITGLIPGTLYMIYAPDGIAHPNRWSYGPWLQALKYTPLPHLASFVFGVLLSTLDEMMPREGWVRFALGVFGFSAAFGLLSLGDLVPYALIHDGMLMPLFGCIVLGLAGENPLASLLGVRPLVFVGEASYCLYLLHFNLWNMIHDSHILNWLGLAKYDPWISYVLLIGMSLLALHYVEKPVQRWLRDRMNTTKWAQAK
ncbi:MAG TPA: acyltransferase [Terracidiphilus sp.]|nr:acyltransferase [Terracidiphilus sp.]